MTAESREELISAYIDGELSADERAQVEGWLAESAELRQLHDELRALRSEMQALERHQLDCDLSGAVLRKAEQSVLRGASKPALESIEPRSTIAAWWNRGAGWRRVVWPVMAAAAALAILLYDASRRPAEEQVAQAPREPADESTVAPPAASEAKPGGEIRGLQQRRQEAAPQPPGEMKAAADALPAAAGRPAPAGAAAEIPPAAANIGAHAAARVVAVSPQYLRDRSFEKLLEANRVKFKRLESDQNAHAVTELYARSPTMKQQPKDRDAADLPSDAPSQRITYVLEADEATLDKLLSGVEQLSRMNRFDVQDQEARGAAPARRLAEGSRTVTVTLVAIQPPAAEPATEQPVPDQPLPAAPPKP